MMHALLLVSLGLALVAAGAGCDKTTGPTHLPDPGAPAARANWPATRLTDRGNFKVTINPEGGSIVRGRHFALDVHLLPGRVTGSPVSVVVDADMPSHGHGMNTKPETLAEGGHRYRVHGMLFHMAGEWSISVDITAGTTRDRVLFPVRIE